MADRGPGFIIGMFGLGIAVIILLIVVFGSFYIVSAGERAVIMTFGKPNMEAMGEGLHFKIPIVQKAVIMTVQTQKYEAELTAASQDLQDVKTKIAINYHLVPELVPTIYQTIGKAYDITVIQPLEQEVNKAITAKFTAEQLITNREEVRSQMKDLLTERLTQRGIIVEEISIVNFEFSPSFTAAIEAKVTTEQTALAAKNKLAQVEYEAQQRIAQAEGEARAIQIQVSAINAQGGASYVQLQSIKQWDGKLPLIMGGNTMPFIDINSVLKTNTTN
jgi:regulator of protease activity HflC (stomatin/prohibitin superfamily)